MPGIVASGNITPQSRTKRRPDCSMTAQVRLISPRPPRKMTSDSPGTAFAEPDLRRLEGSAPRRSRYEDERDSWICRACSSSPSGAAPSGRRQFPAGRPRTPQHRLGRNRRFERVVARLEGEARQHRPEKARVPRSSSPAKKAAIMPAHSRPHQCAATADQADGADREQRQGEQVVAAAPDEVLGGLGDDPCAPTGIGGGVLQADDVLDLGEAPDRRRARCADRCADRRCRRGRPAGRSRPPPSGSATRCPLWGGRE